MKRCLASSSWTPSLILNMSSNNFYRFPENHQLGPGGAARQLCHVSKMQMSYRTADKRFLGILTIAGVRRLM